MLTRLPLVQFPLNKGHGKREPIPTERFGETDHIWLNTSWFEAKERTSSAAANLNIVANKEHIVLPT
jgi:hypothetical protein